MTNHLGPGPHTHVRRLADKARYDAPTVWSIFDEAPYGYLAGVVHGRAMTLPTLVVRERDTLYVHGSRSNAVLSAVVASGEGVVSATLYDGIRLARSAFETSIAYRSAVAMGRTRDIDDLDERARVLNLVVDRLLPGRRQEVREMSDREVRLTRVVAIDVTEASAKVSAGPTDDDEIDLERPIWAGTVHARVVYASVTSDERGANQGLAVPDSVMRLLGE